MAETKPKISLLICHLEKRKALLDRLFKILDVQIGVFPEGTVQLLINPNEEDSIGKKRNDLLQSATGDYVSFIDDDDRVSIYYLPHIYYGILKGVDCCSLLGEITEDGKNPQLFEHSIKYKEYKTNTIIGNRIKYERFPNHLNCIKSSIAKQFKFPEKNHGEDTDWATQIFKSGLIKTEHYIPEIIYYYDYRSKK